MSTCFTRTGGNWSQQAIITKASNTEAEDDFGMSVALSGETLAIGPPGEASCAQGINGDQLNNACPNAGAMYVFVRTEGIWNQQAYVKASNPAGGDAFGRIIVLIGETLVGRSEIQNSLRQFEEEKLSFGADTIERARLSAGSHSPSLIQG